MSEAGARRNPTAPTHSGSEPRFAAIAAMIAVPARARMLAYLIEGHYASAGELAKSAAVAAGTATGHLNKLVEARLLNCEQRGRHRYFRVADPEVGRALLAERSSHE